MNNLLTDNPIALNALMNETLFSTDFSVDTEERSGFEQAEKQTLQTPPVAVPVVEEKVENLEEFVYQGSKGQGVLFILRYPEYDYFSPGAEDAFRKSIQAAGLSVEKVAVVNLANAHNPNDFKRIMAFFNPVKITLLGVDPQSLVLPAIPLNSYMKGKRATVFNTFSFEEMFADQEKKKAFWGEFKKFLG